MITQLGGTTPQHTKHRWRQGKEVGTNKTHAARAPHEAHSATSQPPLSRARVSPFRVATWRRAPPKRLRPLVGLLRLSLGMERSVHPSRVPGRLSSWPPGRSAPSLSDKRPRALLVPCVIQAFDALFFCLAGDLSFLGQTPRRWQAIVLEPPPLSLLLQSLGRRATWLLGDK